MIQSLNFRFLALYTIWLLTNSLDYIYILYIYTHNTHPFPSFLSSNLICRHAKVFTVQKVSRFILLSPRCLPHYLGDLCFFKDISNISFYETGSNHPLLPQAQWNWTLILVYSSVIASETL